MKIRKPSVQRSEAESKHVLADHAKVLRDVYKALRGNISYGRQSGNLDTGLSPDNIDGAFGVVSDTGVVNTQFSVTHNLNRIPIGYHVIMQNKAGSFYTSGTAWTDTQIFLKCSVANVSVRFFIF
jgi:hypothetical protein